MNLRFEPSCLSGSIQAPPSKSMAHRYLICAAFSEDESIIDNIELSKDIIATIDCLKSLGAEITVQNHKAIVKGIKDKKVLGELNALESGSTLRFLIPYAMTLDKEVTFSGAKRLFERPLDIYEKIAQENGFLFKREETSLKVKGSLKGKEYVIDGSVSSQFISGLLFALPMLKNDSVIKIIPPFESKSYVDLTLKAIKDFGVEIFYDGEYTFKIPKNQKYQGRNAKVEGDFSNGAYLDAFNYTKSEILVLGLDEKTSMQGDKVYKKYFEELKKGSPVLDISDCPDLGPILFAVAALNNGGTFTGTKRLEVKESNRADAMKEELNKFGVKVLVSDNSVTVKKADLIKPTTNLSGHNDHRIVMALSVLLSVTGGEMTGTEAVSKSFPSYFDLMKKLNLRVEEYDS